MDYVGDGKVLAYWVTVAILHLFTILQMLGPLIVVMFLCPGANAMRSEQAFLADISFKVFNNFVAQNFSSKITLATVLILFFTMVKNTDLLNLHQCQQNPQLPDENQVNLSSWIKSLACEVEKQTPKPKLKTVRKFEVNA